MATEAYKSHRAGSRKGRVHEIFDTKGRDAAMQFGKKQKLKDTTLNSWLSAFARDGKKKAAPTKAPAKPAKADKATKAAKPAKAGKAKAKRVKVKPAAKQAA